MKKLHDQHGPVVRIGPNTLSLNTPELVKTIYGTDGRWLKVRSFNSTTILMIDPLGDDLNRLAIEPLVNLT